MITTLPLETPGYVVTLFAATLCEESPDSKNKIWNIISTKRNILHVLLRWRFIKVETQDENLQIELNLTKEIIWKSSPLVCWISAKHAPLRGKSKDASHILFLIIWLSNTECNWWRLFLLISTFLLLYI